MDLRTVFNSIHPITEDAWNEFSDLLEEGNLQKNEFLLSEGQRVYDCYFLKEGVIRVFYSKDGNEYNKTFFTPGTFPTAITALITKEPALISFQALTNCSLLKFSFKGFRQLYEKHRCLESLMLGIMESLWIKKEQHDIRMVTNDATTNYLIFRKEYPTLENLIPQYHISSYLGITPIQLSRIRSQLIKG